MFGNVITTEKTPAKHRFGLFPVVLEVRNRLQNANSQSTGIERGTEDQQLTRADLQEGVACQELFTLVSQPGIADSQRDRMVPAAAGPQEWAERR